MILKDMQGMVVLGVFSLALALVVNYLSPNGIALIGQWDRTLGVVTAKSKQDVADPSIEINNPLKVRQLIQNGTATLVDVRVEAAFGEGHLPGAYSFPFYRFDEIQDQFVSQFNKDTQLLVYCSGVDCKDSHRFAARLKALSYKKVNVYAGGFREWQEMGFEVAFSGS